VGSRLPREVLRLTLGPHVSPSADKRRPCSRSSIYVLPPGLHYTRTPTYSDVPLTQVSVRAVSDLKPVDTMTPPDQDGKRKGVDVDLTADDTDTDDLDAPAREQSDRKPRPHEVYNINLKRHRLTRTTQPSVAMLHQTFVAHTHLIHSVGHASQQSAY
jgi:hypothetical protein